ncbi:MAG: hypothetical protein ACP5N2_05560 [Candidatus Nanoarchaeia archaeon]
MVEQISITKLAIKDKILLLKELGYKSDGTFVLDQKGERVIDKYIEEPVTLGNMLILPGSTIIIDNNPLSIASYLQEYPDVL